VSDLTVKILEDIRDDIRGLRGDLDKTNATMAAGFQAMDARFEAANARFEVIETGLRDLAQQLVMLARGVKVAVE
jgi:hypothetical protein